jgi:hypothetical protein
MRAFFRMVKTDRKMFIIIGMDIFMRHLRYDLEVIHKC